jgi:undecaprenyl pyrophosphate phosphatase UppP
VDFVEAVRKRSNGIPYGANMKMPKRADQQFKVLVGIVTAAVVGMFVIDVLLRVIRRIGMMWVAYYRWAVALDVVVVWYVRG